jgi:Mg-chelatase subunit ChlD
MRASGLLVLLLLLAPPPDEADALAAFERAFAPTRRPAKVHPVRTKALDELLEFDSAPVATALLDAAVRLEAEIEDIETKRRKLLAKGAQNRELQSRVVLDPLLELSAAVGDALNALGEPEALRESARRALDDPALPLALRLALAPRVVSRAAEAGPAIAVALGRQKDPGTLTVALAQARALGTPGADLLGPVLACLDHAETVVREETARTLAALARPEGVAPLIERLAREEGATKERIGAALEVLTRQPLGTAVAAWRRWWEENRERCLAGKLPLGGGQASGKKAPTEGARYHDIPMVGEAIVYVIDRSNSMQRALEDASRKAGSGEVSRLDRAKEELIEALGKLPRRKTFNIVTFAGSVRSFADGMRPATPENVTRAQKWVGKLGLELGTVLYDGLDVAFAVAGRPSRDGFYSSTIDTIFVLTDGRPVIPAPAGDKRLSRDSRKRIRAAVQRWNLLGRVTVHTIGLGDELPAGFLRKLAEENGGRFVHER